MSMQHPDPTPLLLKIPPEAVRAFEDLGGTVKVVSGAEAQELNEHIMAVILAARPRWWQPRWWLAEWRRVMHVAHLLTPGDRHNRRHPAPDEGVTR
jgi:hypothetical protein